MRYTHSLVQRIREREKELSLEKKEDQSFGFYLLSFGGIYIEGAFAGFFPLGFSQDKSLCSFLYGCACLYFSDILDYGYAVMMLNVLRSDITIKIQQFLSVNFPILLSINHLFRKMSKCVMYNFFSFYPLNDKRKHFINFVLLISIVNYLKVR